MLPEGKHLLTLRARAVLISGDLRDLPWDLHLYRYALQKVVDALWELDKIPSLTQVHQLFYRMLGKDTDSELMQLNKSASML